MHHHPVRSAIPNRGNGRGCWRTIRCVSMLLKGRTVSLRSCSASLCVCTPFTTDISLREYLPQLRARPRCSTGYTMLPQHLSHGTSSNHPTATQPDLEAVEKTWRSCTATHTWATRYLRTLHRSNWARCRAPRCNERIHGASRPRLLASSV